MYPFEKRFQGDITKVVIVANRDLRLYRNVNRRRRRGGQRCPFHMHLTSSTRTTHAHGHSVYTHKYPLLGNHRCLFHVQPESDLQFAGCIAMSITIRSNQYCYLCKEETISLLGLTVFGLDMTALLLVIINKSVHACIYDSHLSLMHKRQWQRCWGRKPSLVWNDALKQIRASPSK